MMKKYLFVALATLLFVCPNFAQFTTVTYDFERNWFNEGQVLPAEKSMIIKGIAPKNVEMIIFNILSAKRSDELYQATWQRTSNNEFALTVPYMLRASDRYDFRVDTYEKLDSERRKELEQDLKATLDTYVEVNLRGEKDIKLLKNSKKTMRELKEITENVLSPFRNKNGYWTSEFSDVVRLKLEQLEKADLESNYVKGDTTTTRKAVRQNTRQELVNELKAQVEREAMRILEGDILVLTTSRVVDDYMTEAKTNSLSLNVGYGGVYLDGQWSDLSYDAAPYLGIAFPLGNSILGSKFLSNTSVTMGVFLNDLEDAQGNQITGFVVNRPIYVGLDHKLFQFVRINAGATFLEETEVAGDMSASKSVMIRPYVGLSARIDLSLKLGK
ncbi:MAG: hypothetical protein AAGG68_02655 [Bacteroidota bacterium]